MRYESVTRSQSGASSGPGAGVTGSLIRVRFFTGNSIPGTGWGHSFAADDAEPSHHFAQESPRPGNLKNLVANAYYPLEHGAPRLCSNGRHSRTNGIVMRRLFGSGL
ncbi:MAG TPA: hypothetical protein VK463_11890 [Desulfomonilaceae bacterium]|nr:hypothetical protein [Desulfomonilaceae bacterium]